MTLETAIKAMDIVNCAETGAVAEAWAVIKTTLAELGTDTQQLKAEIAYYLDGGEEHVGAGIVILPIETFNKLRKLSAVQRNVGVSI